MMARSLPCLTFTLKIAIIAIAITIHATCGHASAIASASDEAQLDQAALDELAFALESMFAGHKGAVETLDVRGSHTAPRSAASAGSYFLLEFSYSKDCTTEVSNYTYVVTDTCVPLTVNGGTVSVGVKFTCDGTTGLAASAYLSATCCGSAILSSSYYPYADGTCVKNSYGRESGTKYQCTNSLPFTASCPISLYFAKSGSSGLCTYPLALIVFLENTCVNTNSTNSGYELYQEVTCDSSSKNLNISGYAGTCDTSLGGTQVYHETIAGGTCKYDTTGLFSGIKPNITSFVVDGAYYTVNASSQSKITCLTTTKGSSATCARRPWPTFLIVIVGVLLFGFTVKG